MMELAAIKLLSTMYPSKTILSLTADLLANGAFSHLPDDEITGIHQEIMKLQEPLTRIQQNLLLSIWYRADAGNIPTSLLYRCNTVLQQFGRNPIEALSFEFEMELLD